MKKYVVEMEERHKQSLLEATHELDGKSQETVMKIANLESEKAKLEVTLGFLTVSCLGLK